MNSGVSLEIDAIHNYYNTDPDGNDMNQLYNAHDGHTVSMAPGDFIDGYYTYNQIGQLTDEDSYGEYRRMHFAWTPYGKLDSVVIFDFGTPPLILRTEQYLYDAMGNQVERIITTPATGTYMEYSLFDGHNTNLARYVSFGGLWPADPMAVQDRYIYGSERIARVMPSNVPNGAVYPTPTLSTALGTKEYELHDHLGNVRATIKNILPVGPLGTVVGDQYYNYFAFGSCEPGRFVDGGGYPFGFNGQ
jgi:hypothetical protein